MSPTSIGGEFFVLLTGGEHISSALLKRRCVWACKQRRNEGTDAAFSLK